MFSRSLLQRCARSPAQQLTQMMVPKRSFQRSAMLLSGNLSEKIYGVPQEGVYSNLPFKVKNRKFIPFAVWYWGVLGFFFAFPFLSTAWSMYKSGALKRSSA
ncbi:COX8 [Candida oxycetoniae]|uniref:COX8 n=1 Tax=Candida oxycetoniae TaxID=497107 RepID=A0AAI9SZS7_9ASCO|nr:COX8 [Candida oxycetoniae]KAI3405729.2 COX8 [Candida oxycetoniae]